MIRGEKVILREKRLSDARDDYRWQTDAELARLDAMPQTDISFAEFLLSYASQLRSSATKRCFFAVETLDGRHIGNCTVYNVDEKKHEAELGIVIGENVFRDRGYGTDAVKTLVRHIFSATKLKRLHLKTLDSNLRAQESFARCGFVPYGELHRDGYHFVLMELPRTKWQKEQNKQN